MNKLIIDVYGKSNAMEVVRRAGRPRGQAYFMDESKFGKIAFPFYPGETTE